jgi:hypothetical protein
MSIGKDNINPRKHHPFIPAAEILLTGHDNFDNLSQRLHNFSISPAGVYGTSGTPQFVL